MADYVLVVDDDPDVLGLVMDVLEALDLEGRSAKDGQAALMEVYEEQPRAIVLDLMMPTMDGYHLIEKLQQTASGREIPIILLSALADNNDIQFRKLPGVVGVLSKGDFSMAKLQTLLTKALEG